LIHQSHAGSIISFYLEISVRFTPKTSILAYFLIIYYLFD
jgi:hypothetical protein